MRIVYANGAEFGFEAADRVLDLIARASCIGVMWGRTIRQLVDGVAAKQSAWKKPRDISCVPLCGDPVFLENLGTGEYSASQLAGKLHRILTGKQTFDLPSLVGVPAYLGSRFQRVGSMEFIESIPGYSQIFGSKTGPRRNGSLVASVDMLLTGIGTLEPGAVGAAATFLRERMVQEKLSDDDLTDLVCGDIGGLLIARESLSKADKRRVDQLNSGWTGISFADLSRVARVGSATGRPGVVVVAEGAHKAPLAMELVKRGYVNQLLGDPSLSAQLKRM